MMRLSIFLIFVLLLSIISGCASIATSLNKADVSVKLFSDGRCSIEIGNLIYDNYYRFEDHYKRGYSGRQYECSYSESVTRTPPTSNASTLMWFSSELVQLATENGSKSISVPIINISKISPAVGSSGIWKKGDAPLIIISELPPRGSGCGGSYDVQMTEGVMIFNDISVSENHELKGKAVKRCTF